MRFIKRLFLFILSLFALVGVFTVLGVAALFIAVGEFENRYDAERERIPENGVLVLDMREGIAEAPDLPFRFLAPLGHITLKDFRYALEAAAKDARIRGVVARFGQSQTGLATAQEIRSAVLEFRKSGKFALAFAESFGDMSGQLHYYTASAFSAIFMQPSGEVGFSGLYLTTPYLNPAMKKIGITAQMDRRGEFKGGVEPLTLDTMSEPVRQNLTAVATSLSQQILTSVAEARSIPVNQLNDLVANAPYIAPEAAENGLIDELTYWDAVLDRAEREAGIDLKEISLVQYAKLADLPPDDSRRAAIIYALGPIEDGKGDGAFAPARVTPGYIEDAFSQALEDPDIEAIILRINSPGGSYVASDTIWRIVSNADKKKPVIISMGDMAASGGYFIALGGRTIIADPASLTGSIGVFGGKVILSELMKDIGVNWESIETAENADFMSPFTAFSPAQWEKMQKILDYIYTDFAGRVAQRRNIPPEQMEEIAQGRIHTGQMALDARLIDRLGGLDVAIATTKELMVMAADQPLRLEQFPKPQGFLGFLRDFDMPLAAERIGAALQTLNQIGAVAEPLQPYFNQGLKSSEPQLLSPPLLLQGRPAMP